MKILDLSQSNNIGGHKFTNNDLDQLNQQSIQLAKCFAESFGDVGLGGRIIAGVKDTSTATEVSYTGGWIYSKGAMWRVNPLLPTPIDNAKVVWFIFRINNNYPAVTYESGIPFQVHKELVIDIVYQSTPPSGALNIDYTALFFLTQRRIEDISADVFTNTLYRNDINAPWVFLNNVDTAFLIDSGITNLTPNSYLKYKIIGSTLHLNINLDAIAPFPRVSVLNFPTGIDIKVNPSILASDTQNIRQPARIDFTPSTSTDPAQITINRSHNNTSANIVSFSVILELA